MVASSEPRLLRSGASRWLFHFAGPIDVEREYILAGETNRFSGRIANAGSEVGTVYVILRVFDSYPGGGTVLDTDATAGRFQLRMMDIAPGETRPFGLLWRCPPDVPRSHYSIEAELWSPPRLFHAPDQHLFHAVEGAPAFFVTGVSPNPRRQREGTRVFVSYSHCSEDHRRWVHVLSDTLKSSGVIVVDDRDALPGDDLGHFMETGVGDAEAIVLVCSRAYVERANSRAVGTGVGYETILSQNAFNHHRDVKAFIPVLRDADPTAAFPKRLPLFLGGAAAIDMDRDDWQGDPLQRLLDAIRSA